ncbi:hypothetical protein KUTeg_005276 [Tegillarca granosa]|uniref:Uncharacterized protein n=1 Tax=Tegillarca granosa TaxID=220873 RepID=A0ABQ9FL73_TEGGR|nr:hypothetical protein KUTeg_005276 [Tegillarca granosa]
MLMSFPSKIHLHRMRKIFTHFSHQSFIVSYCGSDFKQLKKKNTFFHNNLHFETNMTLKILHITGYYYMGLHCNANRRILMFLKICFEFEILSNFI